MVGVLESAPSLGVKWRSGALPLDWQTMVVIIFKKVDHRVWITFFSLTGICPLVEPLILEEQCTFCTGHGPINQLFSLSGILELA